MSLFKYIKRFEYMNWLINTGKTGNVNEFANKLGLSRRQLLDNLKDFKKMGAPIKYSKLEEKYYYKEPWNPYKGIFIDNIGSD